MGRKDAAAIDIVTQGIEEIEAIEKEVLNSMPIRSLLYRTDGHDEIGKRINMPAGPLGIWRSYHYPLNQTWRPGIRSVGNQFYDLHLTFPELVLNLASTSPDDLKLKEAIGKEVKDPMHRLELFKQRKGRAGQ